MKLKIKNHSLKFLVVISLIFTSCHNNKLLKETSEQYDNGNVKTERYYMESPSGKQLVKEIQYYQNGQKRIEGSIKDGNRNGKWTFWFEHGPIWSEGFYSNGIRTDSTWVYHENGTLFYKGTYLEGEKHGTWKFYDDEENLVNQVIFDHGKLKEQTERTNKLDK
jgi:antitoxin component YwqK of YwqJK toxin-antitoxin module